MKVTLKEMRELFRSFLSDQEGDSFLAESGAIDEAEKPPAKEKKPVDPRKKIGKVVSYLDRPFRVRDYYVRQNPMGYPEQFYVGVFDDEPESHEHFAPIEKIGKKAPARAKNPTDFDKREFLEQDVEHFLRGQHSSGKQNIEVVRERWKEISKELSWMEKYIFDNKWLSTPMAKSNEQIALELDSKLPVIKAAESRAFTKIEKILTRDDSLNHDLHVIKQARNMLKDEQPMAKIIVFLQSELEDKNWLNKLDFIQ